VARRKKEELSAQNLIRALNHPLRVRMLEVLSQQESSPKLLEGILGEKLQNVSYHARVLHKCGCVELTRVEQKRGAVEHFYRALPEAYIGHRLWRDVPNVLKGSVILASLKGFTDKLIAALKAGAADKEETSLSATTFSLDAAGREEAAGVVRDAFSKLEAIDNRSRRRAVKGGSGLTPFMGAVAFFATASASGGKGR
jgi:DNA-binding transcriptional ArsR family regulator